MTVNWNAAFNYWKRVDELLNVFDDEVKLEWLSAKLGNDAMRDLHGKKASDAKEEIDRLLDTNPEDYQA